MSLLDSLYGRSVNNSPMDILKIIQSPEVRNIINQFRNNNGSVDRSKVVEQLRSMNATREQADNFIAFCNKLGIDTREAEAVFRDAGIR